MKQFKKLAAPLLAAALLMGTTCLRGGRRHIFPQAHLRLTPPPLLQTL